MIQAIAGYLFIVAFPVLGVMVLIWFRQLSKLFVYLRENHPKEYKDIGEPTLILNNTPKNNIALLRFIHGRRPSELGDEHLARWCQFLTRFFYAYAALFILLIVLLVAVRNAIS